MAGKNEVDPYANEIASAKARMADQQYSNQSWGDWTGDVVGNALNTAKSILPTALGGKGEVGISDMARGAYEAGKDAVTFPGDVLTGKQALFDERGRPLEQAVGRSFNAASTLGGASSVVPKPSNSLGVFGGIGSRTADQNALTKAQIMERQGASPDEIWQQTGWGRGAEEKWRYEIPDTNAVIRTHAFQPVVSKSGTPYKRATLAELLDHPELFAAYPEFKNMQVNETFNDVNGYYMPRFERGTINPGFSDPYIALNLKNLPLDENKFSTLLHEAQHGIQQKEGFAPGSNPGNFEPDTVPNPSHKIYKEAEASDPAFQEFHYILNSPDYKKEINASNALFDAEVQPRLNALNKEQKATGKDLYDEMDAILNEHRLYIRNKFPQIGRLDELGESLRRRDIPLKEPKKFLTPEEAYRHAAGEVESRNVQSRRDMPLEKLRSTAPWKTEEYPKERQIIDWNDTSWRKGYDTGGRIAKGPGGWLDDVVKMAGKVVSGEGEKAVGIIPGTFPGKKLPRVDALANNVDKFVYHSGVAEDIPSMKHGVDPQIGPWVTEVLKGSAEDDLVNEVMENAVPVSWWSKRPDWAVMKVARKLGKNPRDVTPEELAQHGHVALIPKKDPEAESMYWVGEQGLSNGPYSEVEDITGRKLKAYGTDLYSGNYGPEGVESNEYITPRIVEPYLHLTGGDLVEFLRKTGDYNKASGGRIGGNNSVSNAINMARGFYGDK